MSTTATESFDRGVDGTVSNDTIRPSLFIVPSGTYLSNGVYGSGTAASTDYDANTVRGSTMPYTQSKADIRQHDHEVMFTLGLTLDLNSDPPDDITGDELRIRTLPITASEPGRYLRTLPGHDTAYGQPFFEDVEILLIDAGNVAVPLLPGTIAGNPFPFVAFRARLLHGGQLALLKIPEISMPEGSSEQTPQPLLASDIASLFFEPPRPYLRISVRGRYRAISSSAGVAS